MCWAAVIVLSLALVPRRAAGYGYTADEVDDLIGGILAYKLDEAGADDVQEWIDGYLSKKAGVMSEWYIIALSQDGVRDMGSYERALKDYIGSNKINSATTREKYALALCAAGSSDSYIADILDDSIGATGIMSRIYGLHILNNGYTCNNYTAESVADELLSMQYNDGGWALFGEYGDIDVTAMTIQALAPYYDERGDVHSAIDRGLELLSRRQMDDGGYQSFGTPQSRELRAGGRGAFGARDRLLRGQPLHQGRQYHYRQYADLSARGRRLLPRSGRGLQRDCHHSGDVFLRRV